MASTIFDNSEEQERKERQAKIDELLAMTPDERQKMWDELKPSSMPRVYEPYPVKRKKLAEWIHYIDAAIKTRSWPYWQTWNKWDFHKMPISFCFECQYPARLRPYVSAHGDLKKLECEICDLVHYESKYD